MKWQIRNKTLLLYAGILWLVAGCNILLAGIGMWHDNTQPLWLKISESSVVMLFFLIGIFNHLFRKHTQRITHKEYWHCPFAFFDRKGWFMMAFMMSLGICMRRFHWLPTSFLTVFYCGLAVSLLTTGIRFLAAGCRKRP